MDRKKLLLLHKRIDLVLSMVSACAWAGLRGDIVKGLRFICQVLQDVQPKGSDVL